MRTSKSWKQLYLHLNIKISTVIAIYTCMSHDVTSLQITEEAILSIDKKIVRVKTL